MEVAQHELERQAWDKLTEKYNPMELEIKLSKLEAYRSYYKKYPYDGTTTWLPLEDADDMPTEFDPFEYTVNNEAMAQIMVSLTPKQRVVVELSAQGYKPIEIAERQGQTSNNWRWHKSAAKKKLVK